MSPNAILRTVFHQIKFSHQNEDQKTRNRDVFIRVIIIQDMQYEQKNRLDADETSKNYSQLLRSQVSDRQNHYRHYSSSLLVIPSPEVTFFLRVRVVERVKATHTKAVASLPGPCERISLYECMKDL